MALAVPGSSSAATLSVPGDHDTIGEAIAAASPGDTITVAAGTWDETLSIGKDLVVAGDGSGTTTLTTASGPLISVSGGLVEVSGFTLDVTTRGRGVSVSGGADLTLDDLVIAHVPGERDGGALQLEDAGTSVHLTHCALSSNLAAAARGGLIKAGGGTSLTATSTVFELGSAGEGGAIWAESASVSLTGCTLQGNVASGQGGAVYAREGSLTLVGSTLSFNTAGGEGGAVYVTDGDAIGVEACDLSHNIAIGHGGALSIDAASEVEVAGSLFCVNDSTGASGGGAWLSGVSGSHTWHNNAFVENTAALEGGALHAETTVLDIVNNHFLTHSASTGGAVYVRDADVDFVNNLVAWTASGDGLTATSPGTWSLGWGDWWANTATDVSGDLSASDLDPTHLFVDPELVDYTANGDCTDDDLSPGPSSPLVDAGDPSLLDADGSRSDIGAYGGPDSDLMVDADGDGWPAATDCDDDDPAVNPGAAEVCDPDNTDEDCDGDSDDDDPSVTGRSTWCADADADGYGDADTAVERCDPPSGHVADCTDCDDTEAAVHPGAVEVCDEDDIDEDCDGLVDGDDPDVDLERWFPDLDGDGYGDELHSGLETCEPPWRATAEHTDCDDAAPDTHPGAPDPPGDGIDQDCTGRDATVEWSGGGGCTCGHGSPALGWLVLLAGLVARRRRS